jgi:hypothetical protein
VGVTLRIGATKLRAILQIAIDTAIFPEGTTGGQLDILARRALWKDGLNYLVKCQQSRHRWCLIR